MAATSLPAPLPVPLAAGNTAVFNFTADLSGPGTHTIDAQTQLAGDEIPGNDAFTGFTVENQSLNLLETSMTMGFETTEDLSGWAIIDGNSDAVEWFYSTNNPNSGSRAARYRFNNAQAADDWLFSQCLYFEVGQTYQVSFYYRVRNSNRPEDLTLLLTSDQNTTSTVATITTLSGITNTTYLQSTADFNVSSSGTYHLAWRVTSPANQRGVYVDDVMVNNRGDGLAGLQH